MKILKVKTADRDYVGEIKETYMLLKVNLQELAKYDDVKEDAVRMQKMAHKCLSFLENDKLKNAYVESGTLLKEAGNFFKKYKNNRINGVRVYAIRIDGLTKELHERIADMIALKPLERTLGKY